MIFYLAQESARHFPLPSGLRAVEVIIDAGVQWVRLIIETMGVLVVCLGVAVAAWKFFQVLMARRTGGYTQVRLTLARYLVLGLELQLAADILSTAISPTWEQIGRLAAIAVIRTGLNYFLMREMREERALVAQEERHDKEPPRAVP